MKNILVAFNEDRPVSTYTYVLNFIKLLSGAGYNITFLISNNMKEELKIPNVNFVVVSCDDKRKRYFKGIINHYFKHMSKYDYIISYSIEGLWLQLLISLFSIKKIHGAYFSMEIFDIDIFIRPKWFNFLWKIFKKNLEKFVDFSVIQDEYRAALLKETIPYVSKEVLILPNSYIGFTDKRSDYAYKKFGISKEKKILLYSGAIEEWAIDTNLVKVLLPLVEHDYVLVLSGFSRDGYADNFKENFSCLINDRKLIISLEILSEIDYAELVKSCYIALAWYKKPDDDFMKTMQGKNIYYMGMSSGKLMRYLSCCKPVIIPKYYYGYDEFAKESKTSVACKLVDIPKAIKQIDLNYSEYLTNINKYYLNSLEYESLAKPILDKLVNNLIKVERYYE